MILVTKSNERRKKKKLKKLNTRSSHPLTPRRKPLKRLDRKHRQPPSPCPSASSSPYHPPTTTTTNTTISPGGPAKLLPQPLVTPHVQQPRRIGGRSQLRRRHPKGLLAQFVPQFVGVGHGAPGAGDAGGAGEGAGVAVGEDVGDGVFGEEVGGMVAVVVAGGEEVAEFAVGGEGCVSWAGDVGNQVITLSLLRLVVAKPSRTSRFGDENRGVLVEVDELPSGHYEILLFLIAI